MVIPFYLTIKGVVESIFFGPGIFVILLVLMCMTRRKSLYRKEKTAYRIGLFGLLLIISITFPPFFEIVSSPLSILTPKTPMVNTDAIVVLGGGVDNEGMPSLSSMERVYRGGKLFLEGRAPFLILSSGGTNSLSDKSEAAAMRMIARGMGIPDFRIILEEKSYNTYTNAIETKKLLSEYNIRSITLVTSYFHLYRAYKVFEKQEIAVDAVYGKKRIKLFSFGWGRASKLQEVLHEYAAILLYMIRGWM